MAERAIYFGYNPPFIGGPQNIMSRQVDGNLIKNDVVQLVLTSPGERAYRPTFGTKLRSTIFETLDPAGLQTLAADIRTAIATYEDRVKVTNVITNFVPSTQTITVRVEMVLVNNPLMKYAIDIAMNQSGLIEVS